jgi:CRP-like cAMP-binding protein
MDVVAILQQVELFRGLNRDQLQQVSQIVTPEVFDAGEVIWEQGEEAKKVYVISDGQVEILIRNGVSSLEPLLYLGSGQVIGEMALVDDGRRSASVVAIENATQVLAIPNHEFRSLCEQNTDIGYIVMRNIAQDMSFKLRHHDYDAIDRENE